MKAAFTTAAHDLGFDVVGVTLADAIPQALPRLRQFLAEGAHGDMDWMATTAERRGDPRMLWPLVRSVIMLGLNYAQDPRRAFGNDCADDRGDDPDPLAILRRRDRGAISVYAQGNDYHDIIKPRLGVLAHWLTSQGGGKQEFSWIRQPLMEKPLAAAAGLGWQGKHTNLVSRQFGSWFFLGAIFTTLDLPPDAPEADHCGNCRACLDICPTAPFRRRIGSTRAAASRTSPSSTKDLFRANCAPPSATASMAATIAWRYALGTSSRRSAARRSWRREKRCGRLALPISPGSTMRLSGRCFRNHRSSGQGAIVSCAMS